MPTTARRRELRWRRLNLRRFVHEVRIAPPIARRRRQHEQPPRGDDGHSEGHVARINKVDSMPALGTCWVRDDLARVGVHVEVCTVPRSSRQNRQFTVIVARPGGARPKQGFWAGLGRISGPEPHVAARPIIGADVYPPTVWLSDGRSSPEPPLRPDPHVSRRCRPLRGPRAPEGGPVSRLPALGSRRHPARPAGQRAQLPQEPALRPAPRQPRQWPADERGLVLAPPAPSRAAGVSPAAGADDDRRHGRLHHVDARKRCRTASPRPAKRSTSSPR